MTRSSLVVSLAWRVGGGCRVILVMVAMFCLGLAVPAVADPVRLVPGTSGAADGTPSPVLSSNGRYVLFGSAAANVLAGQVDTNGHGRCVPVRPGDGDGDAGEPEHGGAHDDGQRLLRRGSPERGRRGTRCS